MIKHVVANNRGTLVRKRLKRDAIPSVWPNVPSDLSKEMSSPCTTKMTYSSSREFIGSLTEQQAREKDLFNILKELDDKFCLHDVTVDTVIKRENCILFLSAKTEDKLEIKCCMKLSENLNYKLWCNGLSVKHKTISK